jgi:flagellar basal-body rod protein FlgB
MAKVTFGNDESAGTLKRLLDINAARQRVGARNLANCASDGYTPKNVEFAEELGQTVGRTEVARTHPRHLASSQQAAGETGTVEVVDEAATEDKESRLERAVAELTDAEIAYSTAARLMSKRMATIRTAIAGKL